MATIKVIIDDETHEGELDTSKSVLENGEALGLDLPFSCRGGICSTCMAMCEEGEVEMHNNQVLTDSELAEGYILTCQSKVKTDTIVVNYDI